MTMYIRRTSIKSRKDGTQYFTYRLVESQRIGKKVKQVTLLNLGRNFSLPREQWPELSSRIQDIISGRHRLLPTPGEIEKLAQRYAALVIQAQQRQGSEQDEQLYKEVDIGSLEVIRPRSVGQEHVAVEALRSLKLDDKLRDLGFNTPHCAAAIGTIIGRMCLPGSELATHNWLQNVTGLGELIDFDYGKTSLYSLYQVSDQLFKHKETIEAHLYDQEKRLFGFQETITLYDLTNTYFEGSCQSNSLAAYGHSKEKRTDCPLVTLALVLDSSGFPKKSKVFEGNVSESQTLAEMIKGLESPTVPEIFEQKNATVVMDAGIASEENIEWLKEHGYPYIVVSRKHHREFNEDDAVLVKEDGDYKVKVQTTVDQDTGEALLYCHSTRKEKKEQAIGDRFIKRFEDTMQKLAEGLHKKGCVKKYDKVLERIGRIKQKNPKASKQYKVTVEKDDKSGMATLITWKHVPKADTKDTFPGVYCLRTSHNDWDENKLWHTYTMLTELEAVFRSLKTELGLRPVYHQKTERVTGHLFITVLAYHLVHTIRYRLKSTDINSSWGDLRKQLEGQARVTVTMKQKDGNIVHVRKSTRPELRQQKIYTALGLSSHPGKTIITEIEAQ
jgi:transposase